MREVLNYYYNLNVINIIKKDNNYYFDNYILLEYTRNFDEVNKIYEVNKHNKRFNILVNKEKQILFLYNGKYYLLLKSIDQNYVNRDIDYLDILTIDNILPDKKPNFSDFKWLELWMRKIDYYEYQMEHLNVKYYKLVYNLPYFIGMAENAVSYLMDSLIDLKPSFYDNLVISHKRISSKYKINDLYNPLNIIIDHKARDIAEYIKSLFYNNNLDMDELEDMFDSVKLSDLGYHILFARLLFPTNFFDIYDKIIDTELESKNINIVLERVNEYEELLIDIYYLLKKYTNLRNVEWLIKRRY